MLRRAVPFACAGIHDANFFFSQPPSRLAGARSPGRVHPRQAARTLARPGPTDRVLCRGPEAALSLDSADGAWETIDPMSPGDGHDRYK